MTHFLPSNEKFLRFWRWSIFEHFECAWPYISSPTWPLTTSWTQKQSDCLVGLLVDCEEHAPVSRELVVDHPGQNKLRRAFLPCSPFRFSMQVTLYRYAEISRWTPMCTFNDKGVYTCRLFWINRLWFILFLGSIGTRWKNWELSSCAVEIIERGYWKDKSWLASSAHRKKM